MGLTEESVTSEPAPLETAEVEESNSSHSFNCSPSTDTIREVMNSASDSTTCESVANPASVNPTESRQSMVVVKKVSTHHISKKGVRKGYFLFEVASDLAMGKSKNVTISPGNDLSKITSRGRGGSSNRSAKSLESKTNECDANYEKTSNVEYCGNNLIPVGICSRNFASAVCKIQSMDYCFKHKKCELSVTRFKMCKNENCPCKRQVESENEQQSGNLDNKSLKPSDQENSPRRTCSKESQTPYVSETLLRRVLSECNKYNAGRNEQECLYRGFEDKGRKVRLLARHEGIQLNSRNSGVCCCKECEREKCLKRKKKDVSRQVYVLWKNYNTESPRACAVERFSGSGNKKSQSDTSTAKPGCFGCRKKSKSSKVKDPGMTEDKKKKGKSLGSKSSTSTGKLAKERSSESKQYGPKVQGQSSCSLPCDYCQRPQGKADQQSKKSPASTTKTVEWEKQPQSFESIKRQAQGQCQCSSCNAIKISKGSSQCMEYGREQEMQAKSLSCATCSTCEKCATNTGSSILENKSLILLCVKEDEGALPKQQESQQLAICCNHASLYTNNSLKSTNECGRKSEEIKPLSEEPNRKDGKSDSGIYSKDCCANCSRSKTTTYSDANTGFSFEELERLFEVCRMLNRITLEYCKSEACQCKK